MRVHAVIVTYRRPDHTAAVVSALFDQSRPPDTTLVVNNGPSGEVAGIVGAGPGVRVVDAPDNLGPAGGWGIALREVLAVAADDDWLLIADDETPPPDRETVARLLTFALAQNADDSAVAGVGLVGGRYRSRSGRVQRIPDDELHGAVDVDTIGGGHWPLLRIGSIRDVELPDAELFFGFEELEYFLKVRHADRRLVIDGDAWMAQRRRTDRLGVTVRQRRREVLPPWRAYYSTRNEIVIARRFGGRVAAALAATRGVARAARDASRLDASAVGAHLRGTIDGVCGKLGRTRQPPRPDSVSASR